MSCKPLRLWAGPLVLFLLGFLVSVLIDTKLIPDLVFIGKYQIDLAALVFYTVLLASFALASFIWLRERSKHQVEKVLATERTAQAQERQLFLRRLDHELKNPLTTIRLGIANLQEERIPGENVIGTLERIAHQVQRIQTLIEDLRRLTEMEESSLDRTQVDLSEILAEAVESACGETDEQGREVQLTIQQVPWPLSSVCGDRDLLVVAFRNLVENALKYAGLDKRVEVHATEDGHSVLVEVADNGRGILPQDLPHIFDELYRGENARDLPGSGLGLALVRRIIELHEGSVEIISRPEQGTLVRVHLPIYHG